MEDVVKDYLKAVKKGGITGPFVVVRFATQILHSQDKLLTHQNLFVRFIPEKAHKWLVGYIFRGCYATWGQEACEECYKNQKAKHPMVTYEREHETMLRLMKWYWIKNKGKKPKKAS